MAINPKEPCKKLDGAGHGKLLPNMTAPARTIPAVNAVKKLEGPGGGERLATGPVGTIPN